MLLSSFKCCTLAVQFLSVVRKLHGNFQIVNAAHLPFSRPRRSSLVTLHITPTLILKLTLILVATYLCVNRQCTNQFPIIRKFSECLVFVLRISLRNDSEGTMRLGAQYNFVLDSLTKCAKSKPKE